MASSTSPSPASGGASRSATPSPPRPRKHNSFLTMPMSDSSSDEDTDILRPRGKMAARMQVRGSSPQKSDPESETDAQPTRVGDEARLAVDQSTNVGNVDEIEDEDDEDDVIAARPRKLVSRRERSSTPAAAEPQEPASSPRLFVTPTKPQSPRPDQAQSDDDLPSPAALTKNPRFMALVAKKREARLAKEAEEARKKAERQRAASQSEDDEDDNITDDEGGRKLTQEVATARPSRKASKRALEEMNRETQRLTRSLQLAHEAKVKKKITKSALFERFNFKSNVPTAPAEAAPAPAPASSSRAPTPVSAQHSDTEMRDVETPPSSPPHHLKDDQAGEIAPVVPDAAQQGREDDDDDFPNLEEMIATRDKLDKGKGKATAADLAQATTAADLPRKRNFRVKLPPLQAHPAAVSLSLDDAGDDDSDLQIQPKSKIDAIFDRIPLNQAKEARPLQLLRRLAHLDDPDKKPAPPARASKNRLLRTQREAPALSAGALHASLLQRARAQAKVERDRHLELLRAKGVHVQTAEEREREMQDVEDIVAKARREAEEIMEREREAAREERKRRREAGEGGEGEEDPLGWDESDEEEYVDDEAEGKEEVELELSGSEEEEMGEEEEEEEEGDLAGKLIDDAAESAEESDTGDGEEPAQQEDSDEEVSGSRQVRRRPRKHVTILSDDEDEAAPMVEATPRPKNPFARSPSTRAAESPSVPTSVLRSATKTFIPGLPVAGPAGLGLTQIFAGTMDDSQMGSAPADSPSQPRPTFDVTAFPDSNFSQTAREVTDDLVLDSQPMPETQQPETQGVQLHFSQSQMHGFDTFLQEGQGLTQASDLIEPTQDSGFHNFTPLRQRFVEPPASTADTIPVPRSQVDVEQNDSPLVRRTGKLRRKVEMVPPSPTRRAASEEMGEQVGEGSVAGELGSGTVPTLPNDAFAAMQKAARREKKRQEAFDKKKSKARDMVEDQAEESEDEYAGLGGADGEDSDDDDDQSVKEMIDDQTQNDEGDERKLAAFYADRERAADEKQVDKLFHDITTGMLRRKRNGNWDDLSDDEDDGEARRRMKRRQFAKMQRALFADERISKVAENPRNQAFLRTIEDRGSDDEMDFIMAPPPVPARSESQDSQASAAGTPTIIPNSQPQPAAARPANPRRTKQGKKPSNIGEIRESLSNLLDEPAFASSSLIPATEVGSSDDEAEDAPRPDSSSSYGASDKENRNPRRSKPDAVIIDRISLKRNASSASSASTKLAFAAGPTNTTAATGTNNAGASGSGSGNATGNSTFRVPTLLRRATTNSLLSTTSSTSSASASSTGVTTNTSRETRGSKPDDSMKIKKTAGKRSGVSYLAREHERRAAVAEAERRREERKWRGAEGRVKAVGGLFGAGKFE